MGTGRVVAIHYAAIRRFSVTCLCGPVLLPGDGHAFTIDESIVTCESCLSTIRRLNRQHLQAMRPKFETAERCADCGRLAVTTIGEAAAKQCWCGKCHKLPDGSVLKTGAS